MPEDFDTLATEIYIPPKNGFLLAQEKSDFSEITLRPLIAIKLGKVFTIGDLDEDTL